MCVFPPGTSTEFAVVWGSSCLPVECGVWNILVLSWRFVATDNIYMRTAVDHANELSIYDVMCCEINSNNNNNDNNNNNNNNDNNNNNK